MRRINQFLTPGRRKAIYGVVAAALAALIAFDVVSADQVSETITAIVGALAALSSLMAFVNVSPGPHDQ